MATILFQFLSGCLCMILLFLFINKIWWTPVRLQSFLRQQGLTGPPYKIFYGNTKEIRNMRKESMNRPMEYLSSHNLFARLFPHFHTWLNIYGKNFVSWYGPRAQFFITDLNFVKETLSNHQTYPKAKPEWMQNMLLGDGLSQFKGEKWEKHRKLANHAFHAENLKSMTPIMIESVKTMLERWKEHEGNEIDVLQEFKRLTADVISRTAFGSNYLEGKDIFHKMTQFIILLSRNTYKIKLPGISLIYKNKDELEAKKLDSEIYDSIQRIIEKRETESTMSGEVRTFGTDFLGLLIKAKNCVDKKNRINAQDVVGECKTFYVAGQETTTNLLSWAIFLLGIHTDWQEKARQEVLNLIGQEVPSSDCLVKLKTVNMIINETLRLYPPAVILTREVKEETKLGKLTLPANVQTVVSIPAIHLDKEIWGDDALLFKPERFSQGVAAATNNNPAVFIPFGFGPRKCVGNNFALNESRVALAMILQRYSFTLSPTYVHSPAHIFSTSPQHGVQVMLQPL